MLNVGFGGGISQKIPVKSLRFFSTIKDNRGHQLSMISYLNVEVFCCFLENCSIEVFDFLHDGRRQ